MAPRANLQREPDRCSRDLLGTTGAGPRWVYRLGYLSPCQEVQGRGPLRFASSSQKQAALDGIFFLSRLCFPVHDYRRFIWVSVQASIFLVLRRTLERLGFVFYW